MRSCNLLRDKQTPVAGILHRCALRLEAGASRQESRLARDRRSLLSESVSWLRSRQIEAAALRKTSSGPIDLSIPDSLAFTNPFFPKPTKLPGHGSIPRGRLSRRRNRTISPFLFCRGHSRRNQLASLFLSHSFSLSFSFSFIDLARALAAANKPLPSGH